MDVLTVVRDGALLHDDLWLEGGGREGTGLETVSGVPLCGLLGLYLGLLRVELAIGSRTPPREPNKGAGLESVGLHEVLLLKNGGREGGHRRTLERHLRLGLGRGGHIVPDDAQYGSLGNRRWPLGNLGNAELSTAPDITVAVGEGTGLEGLVGVDSGAPDLLR